ncbi:transmembrane protein 39A-B-like [Oppia nitens]|uniref:transmembrane protein 39A-B-like n=1 Tax=Oppia nitens TaxID=1686743 RepID=UPI0023DA3F90|nr:transmembrane protein 39A-B-like [Oppia nitens]XP_054165555.1 transmembrane protein 39A-B-like [Oppia nitens]
MGRNNKLFLLMPNHRRNASKLSAPKPTIDDRSDAINPLMSPKHINLPKLSPENELLFEAQTVVVFIISMATQYLNLYRTVWWLPQSHTNIAMNFHLIDTNVVQFCLLFIGRPFVLHLAHVITSLLPSFVQRFYLYSSSLIILVLCICGHIMCSINIYSKAGITGILCISYPIVIYILMYCPNVIRAYESSKTNGISFNWFAGIQSLILPTKFSSQQPTHTCTTNAELIREEVDRLKTSFNERLKFILFRSLLIAYYSSFVNLCFAPNQLYYDMSWTAQHVVISWMTSFLMLTSHLYSPQFYDILHKSSLHLGKWIKLETRNALVPCNSWSDQLLYGQGVVVKYSKEYFKSEGSINSAEPGNQSHLRYYIVFSNPIGGFGTLLGFLVVLIFVQMVLLIRALEWYKLISMSLMILINSLTIFRLVRSFVILKKVYEVETKLQQTKHNCN